MCRQEPQQYRAVLIEQTAKTYKLMQLIGLLGSFAWLFGMFVCIATESWVLTTIAAAMCALHFCLYVAGGMLAWWHHG